MWYLLKAILISFMQVLVLGARQSRPQKKSNVHKLPIVDNFDNFDNFVNFKKYKL